MGNAHEAAPHDIITDQEVVSTINEMEGATGEIRALEQEIAELDEVIKQHREQDAGGGSV